MSKKERFYIAVGKLFDNTYCLGPVSDFRDIDFVDMLNDLDEQLEEKDKEIERLKSCVMSREQVEAIMRPEISNLTKQITKEITPIIYKECCHQICEKIRDAISQEKLNIEYSDNATKRIINEIIGKQFAEDKKSFVALIDQIEKGE